MLSEKKKSKRKTWYLKRNISCDAHLLNELLETDVSWDDAIVVLAGKLRKLWYSLNELRSSVCERRLERTVLRPALLSVKTAQFTQFFPSCMTSLSKIAQFNWQFIGCLRLSGGLNRLAVCWGTWFLCSVRTHNFCRPTDPGLHPPFQLMTIGAVFRQAPRTL